MKPEVLLFIGAGVVSLVAFTTLILVPAIGSFNRSWEKLTAAFLSLIVLVALVAIGGAIGIAIIYFWDEISTTFS